jgi:hypothetical protein
MTERKKLYIFLGLLVMGAVLYLMNRNSGPTLAGLAGPAQFQPLRVDDPSLRLDLLDHVRSLKYEGTHRNIFAATPPPPPAALIAKQKEDARRAIQGPQPLPPPPPLTVPATYFGFVTNARSGKKQAFFTNGEDVYVVEEGGMLLNRFLLLKIGNSNAELQETSSGRHATVNLDASAAPAGLAR